MKFREFRSLSGNRRMDLRYDTPLAQQGVVRGLVKGGFEVPATAVIRAVASPV
jgi:hypothetical protein